MLINRLANYENNIDYYNLNAFPKVYDKYLDEIEIEDQNILNEDDWKISAQTKPFPRNIYKNIKNKEKR